VGTFWTPRKIENYRQASEYTAFHEKLSVLAEPYLDERWTMADIGCGSGLLDIWLAPMVAHIDAIDSDRTAIDDLSARLDDVFQTSRDAAEKIRPRAASFEDLRGESWDVVTMSFFGMNEEVLDMVMPLAKRRALIYMHGRPDSAGFLAPANGGEKFSAAEMEAYLNKRDFVFKKSAMEMQFGQPFKSIEDIHRFLSELRERGARKTPVDVVSKRIADIEERIVKTDRFDYPYYLPKSVSVALFIILTEQGAPL
jgi:SAM-dependent methyltransferase